MSYNEALQEISTNRQKREKGELICIPWANLPKFSKVIPGIEKSRYTIVTANSKVGKTQLTDFMYMYEPLNFIRQNPDCGIDVNILYFSLEISRKAKYHTIMSNRLYTEHGIELDTQNLLSKFNNYILPEEIETLIKDDKDYYDFIDSKVQIFDTIRNPFGIYKKCKDYFEQNGTLIYDDYEIGDKVVKGVKEYAPNNPNLTTIIIIDNYNNLLPEKGGTLFSAIQKFSSDYALTLRDMFQASLVAVQQQASATETQQFTNKGQLIESKLRPSPDGLGDCKLSARDVDYLIGAFAPHRYNIKSWAGYNLTQMPDKYRELSISLSRHGSGFISDHLYFNGKSNYFFELPNSKETEKINKIYTQIKNGEL